MSSGQSHDLNRRSESESDLFTGTIHGNTDCYLQFCAPRLPQGAVSGRVSAAARVRPACAGLSLGRLALVTPTCLLVATSLLSIHRYPSRLHTILGALTLRRRPAVTPSSARTSLEQRSLSPGVTAPLSWSLPIRLPPLVYHVLLSAIQGIERNMPQRLTK